MKAAHDDLCPCNRYRAQDEFCTCGAVGRAAIVEEVSKAFGDRLREINKKPCMHVHDHVVAAGGGAVFNVYRCRYCGEEEWL